jgi:hypothetical protein
MKHPHSTFQGKDHTLSGGAQKIHEAPKLRTPLDAEGITRDLSSPFAYSRG